MEWLILWIATNHFVSLAIKQSTIECKEANNIPIKRERERERERELSVQRTGQEGSHDPPDHIEHNCKFISKLSFKGSNRYNEKVISHHTSDSCYVVG